MRLERDQRRTLAILGVVAGLFVGVLWMPHKFQERRLRSQIEDAQVQLGFQGPAVGLGNLAREVARLKTEASASNKYVPPETELAQLLKEVSSHLAKEQVTDHETQTQAISVGADYSMMPVNMRFQGSFPATFGFLRNLEEMDRLVRVTRIKLHGEASKPMDPLEVSVELCTFFAPSEVLP